MNFLPNEYKSIYNSFKNSFPPNFPISSSCKFIGPLLDLVELKPMKNLDKSDAVNVSLNKILENMMTVSVAFNRHFEAGQTIYETSNDLLRTETFFSITGRIIRNNQIDSINTIYQLNKENYSTDLVQLCESFGCAGYNLNYLYMKDVHEDYQKLPFFFYKNNLNYDALKMFKLQHVKKHEEFLIHYFSTYKSLGYSIEMKTYVQYLNIIEDVDDSLPDYEKLLYDYNKVKGIYKSLYSFNQPSLKSIFSNLENKINLLEVALMKGEIVKIQKDLILDKMLANLFEDMKRLKNSYIN